MRKREEIQKRDGEAFPGKTFADAVLAPVFNTQRDYYYHIFIEISLAHALMLAECEIITNQEASGILRGLLDVRSQDFSKAQYNPAFEDMFFTLEKDLERRIGVDLAGRLHIARSRNDVGICQFRMALREKLLLTMDGVSEFMGTLWELAQEHIDTIMPAYTHTQPAQPTTFAHYLLAFYDALDRSLTRLAAAYDVTNQSTIGAAAITTTGFPISRERTRDLLGFDRLVENAYDAIAGADYVSQTAGALMTLGVDLSRFLKDTLDFCTYEYRYYRLADPYVQISSIMPQKRNPSSLEHARPIVSAAIGEAQTVFTMLHNTPFGDMVDSEEQLQPHVYCAIENILRALGLLTSNFATMTVDRERMLRKAGEGFITATELADTLVRELGLSFRESHQITAGIVRMMHEKGLRQGDLRPEMLIEALGDDTRLDQAMVETALDPTHFVQIRGIAGGPAPNEVRRMLKERKARYVEQEGFLIGRKEGLARSKRLLDSAVQVYL